jgi:hypothetical protein
VAVLEDDCGRVLDKDRALQLWEQRYLLLNSEVDLEERIKNSNSGSYSHSHYFHLTGRITMVGKRLGDFGWAAKFQPEWML